jgi:HEAT repeat protein
MHRCRVVSMMAALIACQSASWAAPAKPQVQVWWERYSRDDDLTVEECAELIRHYSPVIRTWAAYSLGRRGQPAMPVIMDALKDPDPGVRRAGLDAIAGPVALGSGGRRGQHVMTPDIVAEAVPLIAESLKHKDLWVRDGALLAFMVTGQHGARYVPQIIDYLDTDEDWFLRDAAARAIGGLGKEHAQEAILPLATAYTRETHIVPLRKMREALYNLDMAAAADRLVPLLVEALRDPPEHPQYDPWYFRNTTLEILTRMGPAAKGAIPAIEELTRECERGLAAGGTDRERRALEAGKTNLEKALAAITATER